MKYLNFIMTTSITISLYRAKVKTLEVKKIMVKMSVDNQ